MTRVFALLLPFLFLSLFLYFFLFLRSRSSFLFLESNNKNKLKQKQKTTDKKLAQRKHFPSVNWGISYSKYDKALEPFYDAFDPEFVALRKTAREILQKESEISDIVQLVGKDSLAEGDKVTLEAARFLIEDFLQQNGFSSYDRYCPFYKTVEMLRNIIAFYECATAAVGRAGGAAAGATAGSGSGGASGVGGGGKVTFNLIKSRLGDLLYKLSSQKFEEPSQGEEAVKAKLRALNEEIKERFRALEEEVR